MRVRAATPTDAEAIAAIVVECDAGFAELAPEWTPPSYEDELARARDAIASPERRLFVAELDGEIAGYAGFGDARVAGVPADEPGLAHLARLYVRPAHWGTGIALALHERALVEALERGFSAMRLFTPRVHARARRFYEREGWYEVGERNHPRLGLPVVEYRRDL